MTNPPEMTDDQNPLSDAYINALIRQHGYDSPVVTSARLWQWISLQGGENSVTLLMCEARKAIEKLRQRGEPVAWRSRHRSEPGMIGHYPWHYVERAPHSLAAPHYEHEPLYSVPPARTESQRILFPTHLRKMWSGGEVQAWLDEQLGVTTPAPSAKGSLKRYRQWQASQATPELQHWPGTDSESSQQEIPNE